MTPSQQVRIIELADKYIVVDAETDEVIDNDSIGFSYRHTAKEWAEENGYEVVE